MILKDTNRTVVSTRDNDIGGKALQCVVFHVDRTRSLLPSLQEPSGMLAEKLCRKSISETMRSNVEVIKMKRTATTLSNVIVYKFAW